MLSSRLDADGIFGFDRDAPLPNLVDQKFWPMLLTPHFFGPYIPSVFDGRVLSTATTFPKILADQKPRGNNSKGVFWGPIRPAESESELSLAQKNPDHEI